MGNPVSSSCTTSQAREWTYKSREDVFDLDNVCEEGQACPECDFNSGDINPTSAHAFPRGLLGQSVLFDRATQVVICKNDGTAKRVIEVRMLDFVHPLWMSFYEEDDRATASNCANFGSCRQKCEGNLEQTEQGCAVCKQAGSFGNGKYVLPLLSATPIVLDGSVPQTSSTILDGGAANVQV